MTTAQSNLYPVIQLYARQLKRKGKRKSKKKGGTYFWDYFHLVFPFFCGEQTRIEPSTFETVCHKTNHQTTSQAIKYKTMTHNKSGVQEGVVLCYDSSPHHRHLLALRFMGLQAVRGL